MGGRTKVAHVHKARYGLPQIPRCWQQQYLMAFLLDLEKHGAKLFIHDRDAFEWEWHVLTARPSAHQGDPRRRRRVCVYVP